MQRFTSIGGGLGGLAAALVARSGRSVVVHERRGRLGGFATTDQRNGYRFNQGPHVLDLGGEAMGVLRELGLRRPASRRPPGGPRMVLDGNLHLSPGAGWCHCCAPR